MRIQTGFVAALCMTLVLPATGVAQTIMGVVLDEVDTVPVAQAVVILQDSQGLELETLRTAEDGSFRIDVAPGFYSFLVRRIGYQPVGTGVFEVPVGASDVDVTILVPPEQVVLDTVTVAGERLSVGEQVRLQRFYDNQRLGFGAYVTPEYIRQRQPLRVTDLLKEIAGVRVRCGMSRGLAGTDCSVAMVGSGCAISYYIDGNKYRPGPRGIDELPVSTVMAVEIYRGASEIPAEYLDGDSRCGVIAIWTGRAW